MPMPLFSRFKSAWNAFFNSRDPTTYSYDGVSSYFRPDRLRYNRGMERTIIASIYNRIATDVAQVDIRHVKLDDNDRFVEERKSKLNLCFKDRANVDQTGRAFIHDVVMSLMDEGCVAIVPTNTTANPKVTEEYDIYDMRVGKIVEWRPLQVKVDVYNEEKGKHEEVILDKKYVAIIENPFYAVMNEKNSTLQRLIQKLSLLDKIDNQIGSNKLDLIVQLPYTVKNPLKMKQAESRVEDISRQLEGSKYGIAYVDSTEKITQLNRPVENTLLGQIEYLTNQAFSQLGMTLEILNGSADEKTMLNYQSRIIEPYLLAITEEMQSKFLSPTARSQKQAIRFFSNPFRLVPVSQLAEIADKFTRNEIMTSNEIRQIVGMKPSDDPSADELRNKNLSAPSENQNGGSEDELKARSLLKRIDEGGKASA